MTLIETPAERKARLLRDPRWRELRCQTCWGLGLVALGTRYTVVDATTVNGEPYGERICPACEGAGVPS